MEFAIVTILALAAFVIVVYWFTRLRAGGTGKILLDLRKLIFQADVKTGLAGAPVAPVQEVTKTAASVDAIKETYNLYKTFADVGPEIGRFISNFKPKTELVFVGIHFRVTMNEREKSIADAVIRGLSLKVIVIKNDEGLISAYCEQRKLDKEVLMAEIDSSNKAIERICARVAEEAPLKRNGFKVGYLNFIPTCRMYHKSHGVDSELYVVPMLPGINSKDSPVLHLKDEGLLKTHFETALTHICACGVNW